MRGEIIAVWTDTWREVWEPLSQHEAAPRDMFCEVFREIEPFLKKRLSVESLAEVIADPQTSARIFREVDSADLVSEQAVIMFMERLHATMDDLGGTVLSTRYADLVHRFMEKFSIRYELRRPFELCPTLQGIFSNLVHGLRGHTSKNPHLDRMMHDFETSLRDLRIAPSDLRIRTCIQKQMNLLEAIGSAHPGVNQNTLGRICDQVTTWPHAQLKEAMKNLYKFSCDYPGIRHGGTPASAVRVIDMRDLVALSVLLAGFSTYLANDIDAVAVYGV